MATGMRTSLTDTTNQKRVISDVIKNIDPRDVPLIWLLGLDNEKKFNLQNFPSAKIEWLEDTDNPIADQLAEALTNSETGVDVDNATYFHVGDIIQVDDEQMWVSAIAAPTLTVTRGFGGTTAASHNDDSPVYIRSNARLEGAESTDSYTTTLTNPYNYAQTMHEEIKVSRFEQLVTKYGMADTFNYYLAKVLGGGTGDGKRGSAGELMRRLNRTFYYGKRVLRTTSVPGVMGGFDYFVTTNVTTLTGTPALTQKHLEDEIQNCWEGGGMPDTIVVNGWGKRKITSFYKDAVRTDRSEKMGGTVISSVTTEFGELDIVLDRWSPTNSLRIMDTKKLGWLTIDPFHFEELAKTGDYTRGQVVGDYTFALCNEKAHAIISGFSTSK